MNTNQRFGVAMGAYALLLGLAFFLLTGLVLKGVLVLLVAMVAKTLIAWRAGW